MQKNALMKKMNTSLKKCFYILLFMIPMPLAYGMNAQGQKTSLTNIYNSSLENRVLKKLDISGKAQQAFLKRHATIFNIHAPFDVNYQQAIECAPELSEFHPLLPNSFEIATILLTCNTERIVSDSKRAIDATRAMLWLKYEVDPDAMLTLLKCPQSLRDAFKEQKLIYVANADQTHLYAMSEMMAKKILYIANALNYKSHAQSPIQLTTPASMPLAASSIIHSTSAIHSLTARNAAAAAAMMPDATSSQVLAASISTEPAVQSPATMVVRSANTSDVLTFLHAQCADSNSAGDVASLKNYSKKMNIDDEQESDVRGISEQASKMITLSCITPYSCMIISQMLYLVADRILDLERSGSDALSAEMQAMHDNNITLMDSLVALLNYYGEMHEINALEILEEMMKWEVKPIVHALVTFIARQCERNAEGERRLQHIAAYIPAKYMLILSACHRNIPFLLRCMQSAVMQRKAKVEDFMQLQMAIMPHVKDLAVDNPELFNEIKQPLILMQRHATKSLRSQLLLPTSIMEKFPSKFEITNIMKGMMLQPFVYGIQSPNRMLVYDFLQKKLLSRISSDSNPEAFLMVRLGGADIAYYSDNLLFFKQLESLSNAPAANAKVNRIAWKQPQCLAALDAEHIIIADEDGIFVIHKDVQVVKNVFMECVDGDFEINYNEHTIYVFEKARTLRDDEEAFRRELGREYGELRALRSTKIDDVKNRDQLMAFIAQLPPLVKAIKVNQLYIAVLYDDGIIKIFDKRSGRLINWIEVPANVEEKISNQDCAVPARITEIAFLNEHELIVGYIDGTARIIDVKTATCLQILYNVHEELTNACCFTQIDALTIAVGYSNGNVHFFDRRSGRIMYTKTQGFIAHTRPCCLHMHDGLLSAFYADGTLRHWLLKKQVTIEQLYNYIALVQRRSAKQISP